MHAFELALPAARVALAILVNGLWQGPLIALAAWVALYFFRSANATTRYAVWSLALLAVLTVPVFTSLSRISVERVSTAAASSNTVTASAHRAVTATRSSVRAAQALPNAVKESPSPARPAALPSLRLDVPNVVALAAGGVWFVVMLAILVRLIAAFVALERLKRDSLPLALEFRDAMPTWTSATKGAREVRICVSDAIEVPIAVGLFDSMILLPTRLVHSLDATEIDQITLHELGHLLRGDDWTNAIQRIASALLFFNPAVWFISRQMDVEREVACDDYVLQLTGAVRPYAFCLTKMAEMTAWPHRPMPAPGVFITRKNISIRIERLLRTGRAIGSSIAPSVAASALVAMIAMFLVLRTMTPSFAYSEETAPVPPPAAKVAEKPKPVPHVRHAVVPVAVKPVLTATAPPAPHVRVAKKATPRVAPAPHATPVAHAAPALAEIPPLAQAIVAAATRNANQLTKNALAQTRVDGCTGCDFARANLAGRDFSNHSMVGSNFERADLRGTRFDHADMTGANFKDADLRNASFRNADLEGCNLKGARIDGAVFDGAQLEGCSIDARNLSPAQARVFLTRCEGCNFAGANLRAMDLRNIDLTGTNLAGADLRDADLSGAHFEGVNLAGAKLAGAKLDGAEFMGCSFNGVDLRGVDLTHVSLTGSSMSGAIWQR